MSNKSLIFSKLVFGMLVLFHPPTVQSTKIRRLPALLIYWVFYKIVYYFLRNDENNASKFISMSNAELL